MPLLVPSRVGRALSTIASYEIEAEVLPSLLDEAQDSAPGRVIAGFVWGRYWTRKWGWVDEVLKRDWGNAKKAAFLVRLPFVMKCGAEPLRILARWMRGFIGLMLWLTRMTLTET